MSRVISPQVLQFRADSKPFPWATFAMERLEERCPLCHSLLFFANDPCRGGLPPPLPASFTGLPGNPGLSAQEEAPAMPGLVSSEAQGLGTCLSGQKPTSASAVHGMGPQSFLWSGFPVLWCLCRDQNWVAKKKPSWEVFLEPVMEGCWKGASIPKLSSVC